MAIIGWMPHEYLNILTKVYIDNASFCAGSIVFPNGRLGHANGRNEDCICKSSREYLILVYTHYIFYHSIILELILQSTIAI